MGDRFFDLANFSINHELGDDERGALLLAYFGASVRGDDMAALELMRFMSDFREAMWGVVQRAVSTLDFDFDAYATGALRAARADGCRAGVPGRARRLTRRRAPCGALRSSWSIQPS